MGRLDAMTNVLSSAGLIGMQEDVDQIIYLSIDPEKIKQARTAEPELFEGVYSQTIMPGFLPGIKMTESVSIMTFSTVIFANADMPDDVAYAVVKAVLEHPEEVQAINERLKPFSPEWALLPVDVASSVPWHPGAVKVYKEYGVWTPEHEALQQELLQ